MFEFPRTGETLTERQIMNKSSPTLHEHARKHWQYLTDLIKPSPSPARSEILFNGIVATYDAPERAYHNLSHIVSMLDDASQFPLGISLPPELLLAIWLHDIVYDTHAKDNEEQSAKVAEWIATELDMSEHTLIFIERYILATRHRREPKHDLFVRLITDLDLVILGKSPKEFDAYEAAIRQEYEWVSEDKYLSGRAAILEEFIEREHIYSLPFFQLKYEDAARANLKRSIARGWITSRFF